MASPYYCLKHTVPTIKLPSAARILRYSLCVFTLGRTELCIANLTFLQLPPSSEVASARAAAASVAFSELLPSCSPLDDGRLQLCAHQFSVTRYYVACHVASPDVCQSQKQVPCQKTIYACFPSCDSWSLSVSSSLSSSSS